MNLADQRLYSILFRPTEVQDFCQAVFLGGRVYLKTLLTDRDALIRFILEATGRDDLIVGEIKELTEWRSVCHAMCGASLSEFRILVPTSGWSKSLGKVDVSLFRVGGHEYQP